jgi:hypothetical protein
MATADRPANRSGMMTARATFDMAAHAAAGYHLIKSIPIPGDWTWDYVGMDVAH